MINLIKQAPKFKVITKDSWGIPYPNKVECDGKIVSTYAKYTVQSRMSNATICVQGATTVSQRTSPEVLRNTLHQCSFKSSMSDARNSLSLFLIVIVF